jgi:hypothetical protein
MYVPEGTYHAYGNLEKYSCLACAQLKEIFVDWDNQARKRLRLQSETTL